MAFKLPPLPWAKDALGPHIGAETIEYHYGKHHQGYVDTLNKLVQGKPEENKSLEEIIRSAPPRGRSSTTRPRSGITTSTGTR